MRAEVAADHRAHLGRADVQSRGERADAEHLIERAGRIGGEGHAHARYAQEPSLLRRERQRQRRQREVEQRDAPDEVAVGGDQTGETRGAGGVDDEVRQLDARAAALDAQTAQMQNFAARVGRVDRARGDREERATTAQRAVAERIEIEAERLRRAGEGAGERDNSGYFPKKYLRTYAPSRDLKF